MIGLCVRDVAPMTTYHLSNISENVKKFMSPTFLNTIYVT